jgi:hypothetical protein
MKSVDTERIGEADQPADLFAGTITRVRETPDA